jgi:serpin B
MEPSNVRANDQSDSNLKAVVQDNALFALDLYQHLRDTKGNLFFSPYSISVALAMTYAGARAETATQMAQALHLALDADLLHPAFAGLEARLNAVQEKGALQLAIANALWPQEGYPLLVAFLALVKIHYGTEITPVDFRQSETARCIINAWVEEKTHAKIKELIPEGLLSSLTTLVLTNAIYFKGNWKCQFDMERTKDDTFLVSPSEKVTVPMMTQTETFQLGEVDDVQILELPYVGDDLSMILLLPKKIDGLAELEEALSVKNLERWLRSLHKTKVQVFLPRYKMSRAFKLNDILVSMGMENAFGSQANFSGMDGRERGLFISAVLHKAFVDVNEEGTEAAAATAVIMARSAPVPIPTFRADHPFIFLIRENNTGSILFIGRMVNPKNNID